MTLLKERCGISVAISFREDLEASRVVRSLWLEPEVEKEAWRIFKTHKDKEYGFADCTSFALMELHAVKNAFAYDAHFREYGFITHPSATAGIVGSKHASAHEMKHLPGPNETGRSLVNYGTRDESREWAWRN